MVVARMLMWLESLKISGTLNVGVDVLKAASANGEYNYKFKVDVKDLCHDK